MLLQNRKCLFNLPRRYFFFLSSLPPFLVLKASISQDPTVSSCPLFFFQVRPGEPVYAQVNRDAKKKNSSSSRVPDSQQQQQQQRLDAAAYATASSGGQLQGNYDEHSDHWQVTNHHGQTLDVAQVSLANSGGGVGGGNGAAGDSWV